MIVYIFRVGRICIGVFPLRKINNRMRFRKYKIVWMSKKCENGR